MYYSFIYARLHFMVFICFQSLFKVSVWDPIYSSVIAVVAVITHKMFDAGTKHLSATDKCFFGEWFVEIKLKNFSIITLSLWAILLQELVQNGAYSLFQARSLQTTVQSDLPGQQKHWTFLPDLHRNMWWKEFLLHIDQSLICSSNFGHAGVFVNYVSQHNV